MARGFDSEPENTEISGTGEETFPYGSVFLRVTQTRDCQIKFSFQNTAGYLPEGKQGRPCLN